MSERPVDLRGVTDPGEQAERLFAAFFPDPADPFAGWERSEETHDSTTCPCSTCAYLRRARAEHPTTESEAAHG